MQHVTLSEIAKWMGWWNTQEKTWRAKRWPNSTKVRTNERASTISKYFQTEKMHNVINTLHFFKSIIKLLWSYINNDLLFSLFFCYLPSSFILFENCHETFGFTNDSAKDKLTFHLNSDIYVSFNKKNTVKYYPFCLDYITFFFLPIKGLKTDIPLKK